VCERADSQVFAKCLLELHSVPPSFPAILFAALAYGGEDETLLRDLIPSCDACICDSEARQSRVGSTRSGADRSVCPLHAALELLRPFDVDACTSLTNLLESTVSGSPLTVGDVLGDAPVQQPSTEQVREILERAFASPPEDDEAAADEEVVGKRVPIGTSGGDPVDLLMENSSSSTSIALHAATDAQAAKPDDVHANEPLTDDNKARCVIRVVSYKLLECRLPEIVALRRGFHTIKWSSLVAYSRPGSNPTTRTSVLSW
jgi:hypothetical protein